MPLHTPPDPQIKMHFADVAHDPVYRALYAGITYKHAAISLVFDDCPKKDYTDVYPRLRDRGLVAGFGEVWANVGSGPEYTSWQDGMYMQLHGSEMLCHSRTHGSSPASYEVFYDETVTVANEMRESGYVIQQWDQPGSWSPGDYHFDSAAKWDTKAGRAVRMRYLGFSGALEDALSGGQLVYDYCRPLPAQYPYGTKSTSGMENKTLATLQGHVDTAISYGAGLVFRGHASNFGEAGKLSWADFATFLDYLVTKRDAGLIEVLTPSAWLHAQRGMPVNLVADPGFELSVTGTLYGWQAQGSPTIQAGGRTGQCARTGPANYVYLRYIMGGYRSLYLEAWCKSATLGTPTTGRYGIFNPANPTEWWTTIDKTVSVGDTWTRVVMSLGAKYGWREGRVALRAIDAAPADVLWDDVLIRKT